MNTWITESENEVFALERAIATAQEQLSASPSKATFEAFVAAKTQQPRIDALRLALRLSPKPAPANCGGTVYA